MPLAWRNDPLGICTLSELRSYGSHIRLCRVILCPCSSRDGLKWAIHSANYNSFHAEPINDGTQLLYKPLNILVLLQIILHKLAFECHHFSSIVKITPRSNPEMIETFSKLFNFRSVISEIHGHVRDMHKHMPHFFYNDKHKSIRRSPSRSQFIIWYVWIRSFNELTQPIAHAPHLSIKAFKYTEGKQFRTIIDYVGISHGSLPFIWNTEYIKDGVKFL